MNKKCAMYLRVSTDDQTTENQRIALEGAAAQRGWTIVATYEDAGVSGAKSREHRPGLDQMLKDATRGRFDVAMAWSVDRLGRSLPDLIGTMQELRGARVDMFLFQQGLDTSTPAGEAMFSMLGVFAQFERSMIVSRVQAGMDRAKERGTKSGRAIGRPKLPNKKRSDIIEAISGGVPTMAIVDICNVSRQTVLNIRHEMAAA